MCCLLVFAQRTLHRISHCSRILLFARSTYYLFFSALKLTLFWYVVPCVSFFYQIDFSIYLIPFVIRYVLFTRIRFFLISFIALSFECKTFDRIVSLSLFSTQHYKPRQTTQEKKWRIKWKKKKPNNNYFHFRGNKLCVSQTHRPIGFGTKQRQVPRMNKFTYSQHLAIFSWLNRFSNASHSWLKNTYVK